MKLKNLFYLLLALPLAFASCSDLLGDEKEPAKKPTLSVTSSLTQEFDAEGGTGIIKYSLENAPEGAQVSATCEAEWITNITVTSNILFEVAANDGEAREAKIVVSYEEQAIEVSVAQAAKEEPVGPAAPKFTLTSESVIELSYKEAAKSIEYTLENPIEGVQVEAKTNADWISITQIVDGAIDFFVEENAGEARTATITATYGLLEPIVVTVNQAEYVDPESAVTEFKVVECWASSENGGKQWDVTFVEHDALLGDMYTRISFALAEANTQRVSDGTYSVADGSILLNTSSDNGYSEYRYNNSSEAADILDATFTVATDTTAKTISIEGTFKSGDKNIEIKYNGEMRGMDLGEAVTGAIECYEWASVNSTYCNNTEFLFIATSADGSLEITFDIYHTGGSKICPAGTYEILGWKGAPDYVLKDTNITYNNITSGSVSGTVIVEHISGGYKITFDIMDSIDRNFKGCYEGPITGKAQNPA